MRVSTGERVGNYVILLGFAAFALAPILTILRTALSPETPADAAEGGPVHLENFARAWEQGRFGDYLSNSVTVAVLVVGIAGLLSVMAGYALGAFTFPGSQVLFYVFLLGIMVPSEAIVVPLFYDLRVLGLTDTLFAIVAPQVAQSVAFGTFWMRAFFRGANRSIIEAARLDGAGHQRVLWQVLLPVARPAVVTLVLLTFMWTWNEFLIPLTFLVSNANQTVPVAITVLQGDRLMDVTTTSASALLGLSATEVVSVWAYSAQQASGSWQWLLDVEHIEKAFVFAGLGARMPAVDMPAERWCRVLAVNVDGGFFCAREAGRHMLKAGRGAVVNVASIMGLVGGAHYPNLAYHTAKGAVVNFTRALACEWAASGVRVNAVAPTFARTRLTEPLLAEEAMAARLLQDTPMGRFVEPEEVAAAILFLASDAAAMITGVTLPVDGGWLVNGTKHFASLSGAATHYAVLCTEEREGADARDTDEPVRVRHARTLPQRGHDAISGS